MPRITLLALITLGLWAARPLHAEGFRSVFSSGGADVWAAGNGGTVYRSYDGGNTWANASLDTTTLNAVAASGTRVWIAGNGGILHLSTDGGATWGVQTINGSVTVRALAFPTSSNGWAAGDNGTITVTTDGGTTWSSQLSGTTTRLNALWFADALTGYAAGDNGTLLRTVNGGALWVPAGGAGWTAHLTGVSGAGNAVYVTGTEGFSRKSTNAGLTWQSLVFHTDSRSDVNGVCAVSADTAFFIGGGGFIRSTTNGGASFTWGLHGMHAPLVSIHMLDAQRGWVCSDRNNAVMRTTDGGVTWLLPAGTTLTLAWTRRLIENSSIGNTFVIDPWNRDRIYVALGDSIYRSTDRGDSWSFRARIPGGGATHSFYVSPKDSNLWIVANTGGGDAVKRTTNAGATWTTTIQRAFTSYGMPVEMNPDKPDTVYFAPDGTGSGGSDANGILYRSTNFGLTWDTLAATTGFRSPCDIVVVPDSNTLMYVGDGITGSGRGKMWRSGDEGKSWTLIDSVLGSEIPTISISRVRHNEAYNTAWGSGGFRKTTNFGLAWSQVASTGSAWGTDVAKDDPNVVMFGVYGGGISYLSTNAGATFPSTLQAPLSGSNYAVLAYDRATILAQQSGGVYKLGFTYAVPVSNLQTLNLTSPNGGENWQYNSVHSITWTFGNLSSVRLDYRASPADPWQTITASTPAAAGAYAWTIPNAPATQAKVRISDASDGIPVDTSSAVFTISVAAISSAPASLAFDTTDVGSSASDTLRLFNAGTAPLVITSAGGATGQFVTGRTSFTIPAGASDTLSVAFAPSSAGRIADTLIIAHNAPGGSLHLPLSGIGRFGTPAPIAPPNGAGYVAAPVHFQWNPVPTAVTYHLQVAPDSLFAAPVVDDTALAGTSAQSSALAEGTRYFWRVRAGLPGGPTSWGSVWSFRTAATVTQQQQVQAGWNLLSLPVHVADPRPALIYPSASSAAFVYSGTAGYRQSDSLASGEGYWIKFPTSGPVAVTGLQTGTDSVGVVAGWNLIGAISAPVDTGAVQQIPPGLVTSPYFRYGSGYAAADSLQPGSGYWVKIRAPGILILAPPAQRHPPMSGAAIRRTLHIHRER